MPRLEVRDLKNEVVGDIVISDSVFGAEVKHHLLHEIVRMQLNRRRNGTACTKERNAVAGGGRKPYRQKGTGRSRQGTTRSPLHVGGGIVFGPSPRSYDFSPPKKVRRGAMCSALSLFVGEERLIVLDHFDLGEAKTRSLAEVLDKLGVNRALLVDFKDNNKLKLSASNLDEHRFIPPEGLNVYDILNHDQIVITRRAILDLQNRLEQPIRPRRASR